MHPAPSIIVFTTLSGLGFGLMVWLGVAPPTKTPWVMAFFACLAMGLASAGLMSSLLHLGHPERAWKALSQWRSSWLSREGVAAVVTLAVFAAYAGLWVLTGARSPALGALAAALALVTILCTAMIYTQLRTVPRWHDPLTPLVFLAYALAGGALLNGAMDALPWLLAALAGLQAAAWARGDGAFARAGSTAETATGLGAMGRVRLLEPPHTGRNYLLTEMVYKVGRKHARKLRIIAFTLAIALPLILTLAVSVGHALAGLLVLSHLTGTLIARWLFFAEAEHVVGLYYGAHRDSLAG
ncbi:MAG: DmsC/YnfH family molybdoenzyme membrane anchor subunit [Pseudomonadota bacterium]